MLNKLISNDLTIISASASENQQSAYAKIDANLKFQASSLLIYGSRGRFVSDFVGNPEDQWPVVQNFVSLTSSLRCQLVK